MRLFRRKPKPVAEAFTLRTVCSFIADVRARQEETVRELQCLRSDITYYAQQVAQVAKYLAEQERERNAARAASHWQELDPPEKREPESADERLIRLRAEYQQMADKRRREQSK